MSKARDRAEAMLTEAVAAGRLSADKALRMYREEFGAEPASAITPPAPTNDPRRAEPIRASDYQLALHVLMKENGGDELAAHRALAADPQTPERLRQQLDRERERLQAEADARAAAAYEASPEGRRELAAAALAEQQERSALVAQARALIASSPEQFGGLPAADLTDDEALAASGVLREEAPAREPLVRDQADYDALRAEAVAREQSQPYITQTEGGSDQ